LSTNSSLALSFPTLAVSLFFPSPLILSTFKEKFVQIKLGIWNEVQNLSMYLSWTHLANVESDSIRCSRLSNCHN
jgi:hypothetical protein